MRRMDQINVIPFIDIMLVLLAIVLTTATFIAEGRLKIQLPAVPGQPAPAEDRKGIEIGIDAAGTLFYGTEAIGVGPEALAALDPRLAALDVQTPVTLRVDAQARFEPFVGVVERLKSRGLERLTILTRRP